MSRERRSVSLGRHRENRSHSKLPDEDLSTRHNVSNFLLTLQRIQTSEEENRQLRKENELLRQRTRSYRLSSASFKTQKSYDGMDQNKIMPDSEDDVIAADVKRNSLIFVGDSSPASPEHATLEAQYNKLQEDFKTVKDFLKHLFQHALTMSSDNSSSSYKERDNADVNTYNPLQSKQLERSLEDIHGQISQLRNSQEHQQVKMEQVQQALDNVLCQSSVRNDVTMKIVRQQDKMKELTRFCNLLETQLMSLSISVRQAEEKARQTTELAQNLNNFVMANSKNLKGNTKEELCRVSEQLTCLGQIKSTCACKMAIIKKFVSHLVAVAVQKQSLADSKPPADVVDAMTKLERLIGSDWHRLGRMLGLNPDCLDDIGKFKNFDLTSRVEKVIAAWARQNRGADTEGLKQGLDKMDRDILLITEQPMCKELFQLPPEVYTYVIAHIIDVSSILSQVCVQGILSQDSKMFILEATQEHRRASRLLQSVVFMGPPAICALCAALDRHNQSLVSSKIKGCLPSTILISTSQTVDHNNKSKVNTDRSPGHMTLTPSKLLSNSSTPVNEKPVEKQRKKRSRSLFSRKNKLRDSEMDTETAVDVQQEYNYYYSALNMNGVNTSSTSEDSERRDDLPPPGPNRRQYGRQTRPNKVTNSSSEVIV